MKTSHQFARELLAGPDLLIYHFDPSCAGYDDEIDTGISPPVAEVEEPKPFTDDEGNPAMTDAFICIVGNQHEDNGLDADT